MDAWMHAVLWGVLTFGVCWGRKVAVSTGPLIRVEGQPVSIRCNVSEYEGPREQDFEWNMKRGGGGGGGRPSINVVSTFDSRYTDTSLSARVAEGDVAVARLGDSEVELRIGAARPADGGVYSCHTPSTDSVIRGSYKADVELTVIPDTLVVSPAPVVAVTPEGGDLTLTCTVTRQLLHPTFLSVTWSLRKTTTSSSSSSSSSASPEEVVFSLGPLGAVTTGPAYARRYAAGALRLVPGADGAFSVVLSRVTAAGDQGAYVCTARQWTYEEGVARAVVERRGEMGEAAVTPTGQSLNVSASSSSSSSSSSPVVALGQSLGLLCTVAADNLALLALSVTWLRDGRHVVAAMDRQGVVAPLAASNGSSGGGGGGGGAEVGLERTGPGVYRLALRGVAARDAGAYTCRVRASVGGEGGRWHQVGDRTSAPLALRVEQIKPTFSLALSAVRAPQATADPLELLCHVTDITHLPPSGLLGVTWEHTPPPGADLQSAHAIGSLDHHGNLVPGPDYADRLDGGVMSLRRAEPATFKLILLRTQEADRGQYACGVSAWLPDGQGGVAKLVQELSAPLSVSWTPRRPSLGVVAVRRREASAGGATFEMSCAVVPKDLPGAGLSVLVQWQESVEGAARTVAGLSPDGVLQHGGASDPQRRDSLMLTKSGPLEFTFRLAGVQLSDRGFYWCHVYGWTKPPPPLAGGGAGAGGGGGAGGGAEGGGGVWTQATHAESNKVRIDFQENGPSFAVAIQSDRSSVFPWETAKMECTLSVTGSAPKSDDVAYEVSWFFSRLRGGHAPALLASVDRYGVVRGGGGGVAGGAARNTSSDVSVERRDANTYLLRVHGTQDSDGGEYHCSATPWYVSASTGAWTQAQEITSPTVFLTVRFAVWESLKLPLLYGSMASLGVGIFSLVLGLLCAHCCCRNTMHTPRSRNKLMDLEMD